MDQDDYCIGVTLFAIFLLAISICLGLGFYNRTNELATEKSNAAALMQSFQASQARNAEAFRKRDKLASVAEALDPALIQKLDTLIKGDVTQMSVAEAVATKAKIDKRIADLFDIRKRYEAALGAISPGEANGD